MRLLVICCLTGKLSQTTFLFSISHALSHCADILSFANKSNVPGELAAELINLCSRWVQSASHDYDILFAPLLPPRWARIHKPVVSRKGHGHVLYTQATSQEPDGKLVVCHNGCEAIFDVHPRKGHVKFTCTDCESTTNTTNINPRRNETLGNHGLIKTPFPQDRCKVTWERRDPNQPKKFQPLPTITLPAPTEPKVDGPNPPPPSPPPTTSRPQSAPTPPSSEPGLAPKPTPHLAPRSNSSLTVRIPVLRSVSRAPPPTRAVESPTPRGDRPAKRSNMPEEGSSQTKRSKSRR